MNTLKIYIIRCKVLVKVFIYQSSKYQFLVTFLVKWNFIFLNFQWHSFRIIKKKKQSWSSKTININQLCIKTNYLHIELQYDVIFFFISSHTHKLFLCLYLYSLHFSNSFFYLFEVLNYIFNYLIFFIFYALK